jgi:hypothetical protein
MKRILLTTAMRSGSSLLSRMLCANDQVAMTFDSLNYFRFVHRKYGYLTLSAAEMLIRDVAHRLSNRFGINLNREACLESVRNNLSYGSVYTALLTHILHPTGAKYIGDKEALAWTRIPSFLDMYPDGKVLVIVRDPRDVVNSFKHTTIAPNNDYLIALFNVVDSLNHAARFADRHPEQVRLVKFEQLKLNTEETLQGICSFMEIDYSDRMLDEASYTDHQGNSWNNKESLSFPTETNKLAPVGRWRKMMTPEDLLLCEWIAAPQIQKLGLPLSSVEFDQGSFDLAISKITSSPLLRNAFKRWSLTGEGSEKFPLDPTNPKNWDPNWVKNPAAFK